MSHRRKMAQALLLASGMLVAGKASATILTFNNTTGGASYVGTYSNPSDPLSGYGTDVNFGANTTGTTTVPNGAGTDTFNYQIGNGWTPDISMSYGVGPAPAHSLDYTGPASEWPNGATELEGSATNPNDDFYFSFTPAPGYEVRVNSYVLSNVTFVAASSDCTLYENTVGGPTMVPTFAPPNLNRPGTETVDLLDNENSTFYAGTLVLDIRQVNGNDGSLGVYNLNFDEQAVPEPASFACLSLGGLALLRRRKRA
jgi:hypothetical protein